MADIHDRIADGFAAADEIGADTLDAKRRRYVKLMERTDERIEEIWMDARAPLDVTLSEMHAVPVADRDDAWHASLAAMIAAAQKQALIQVVMRPLIKEVAGDIQKTNATAKTMLTSELKDAATEGTTRETFDKAKAARKTRSTVV